MKKTFEYIGILCLLCFSFFLTNKTVLAAKEVDSIMKDIKKNSNYFKKEPVEASVLGNYIIPGINGYKVNIDKSYNNMKKYGIYHSSLYVYDSIKVKKQLKNNLDKYIISGNKTLKNVSIFIYLDEKNIDILASNYNLNYIVNYNFYFENKEYIDNHINGNIILFADVDKKNIKKYKNSLKQNNKYCFITKQDDTKEICKLEKFYSIYQDKIIKNNYLYNVKKVLKNGYFIVLKDIKINEIKQIINYIYSKGYDILNIDNLLQENVV